MTGWTHNDLERMGAVEKLQLATFKKDGTLRKPVTIWVVRVGDDVYVLSWRGREGAWFRHIQRRARGTYFSQRGDEGCDVCGRKL
jgi:hypothetical protein